MSTRNSRRPGARVRASLALAVLLVTVAGVATIGAPQTATTTTTPPRKPAPSAAARKVPPKGPGLGVPATAAQVDSADISIGPDGAGLPPGSGTPAEGEALFNAKCAACHGPQGSGTVNDRLVGGQGTLASAAPIKTIGSYWPYATTVFDYVRRAMPYPAPHSLTDPEAYALTAYLLSLNGIIPKDATIDAKTLPKVQMPNRGNFVLAYPDRQR
jgi:S-disulfanyl-L-cysteine oxidoreductase SoxD